MLNPSCLVCDRQEATHNVFYDVITGGAGSSERLSQQLRRRLEGVLAVTLTLGERAPSRLCTGCEGNLCEIENRVRDFRDQQSATVQRYAQGRRSTAMPSFCDLTGDRVTRCERGSETRPETETHQEQTFQPTDNIEQWADSHGPAARKDVVWSPRVSPPIPNTGCGPIGTAGLNRLNSTGMTVGGNTNSVPQRTSRGGQRTSAGDGSETEGYADDMEPATAPVPQTTPSGIVNQPTTSTLGEEVQSRLSVRTLDSTSDPVNYTQQRDTEGRQENGHTRSGINLSGVQQGTGTVSGPKLLEEAGEQGLNLACHIRNQAGDTSQKTPEEGEASKQADSFHSNEGQPSQMSKDSFVECRSTVDGQSSKYNLAVNPCSCASYKPHSDSQCKNAESQDSTVGKVLDRRDEDTVLDLSQTPKSQPCETQNQQNDAVLDLTLPREFSPVVAHQPTQQAEQGDQNCRNNNDIDMNHPQMGSNSERPISNLGNAMQHTAQQDLKTPETQMHQPNVSCTENMNTVTDTTLKKNQEMDWNSSKPCYNSQMSGGNNLRAPPPLIHVSRVKQEPVEATVEPAPSSLGYMQKMPIMIAPIEEGSRNRYTQPVINNSYDEGFDEPPQKRRKSHKTFNFPQQSGASSRFPVLNTHVSATLNVANPPKEQSTFNGNYSKTSDFNPEKNPAQVPMQTTTRIQGTVRIPLDQLQRLRKTPADISLVTEATVHSTPIPGQRCGPAQPTQVSSTKIPLNIGFNARTGSLKIPISQQLLGSQSQTIMMPHSIPNGGYSYCLPASDPGHPNKAAFLNGHGLGESHDKFKRMHPITPTNPQVLIGQGYSQGQGNGLGHGQKSPNQNSGIGKPTDGPVHTGPSQPPNHQGQRYPTTGQVVSYGWPNHHTKGSDRPAFTQGHSTYPPTIPRPVTMMQANGNIPHGQQVHGHQENMDWQQDKENEVDSDDEEEDGEATSPDIDRVSIVPGNKTDCNGRRQLLRPWLEERLNKNNVPGFEWYDKASNMFKIPWKHRSKNDWRPDNCTIFMEWAIHTGKYRVGIDKPDYCRWKTRLRCAFNQAADIREVKELKRMKCGEPYKVYEFLPKSEVRPKIQAKPKFDIPRTAAMTSQSEIIGQGTPIFPVSQPGLTECMVKSALQKPQCFTSVSGISATKNLTGPDYEGSPPTIHTIQPLDQTSANHILTGPKNSPPTMPASVPVETNNNKFSWDPDAEERPLVIDFDRKEDEDEKEKAAGEVKEEDEGQTGSREPLRILGTLEVKPQIIQSVEKPYLCDLCGQCFATIDTLHNHHEAQHKSLSQVARQPEDPLRSGIELSVSKNENEDVEGSVDKSSSPTNSSVKDVMDPCSLSETAPNNIHDRSSGVQPQFSSPSDENSKTKLQASSSFSVSTGNHSKSLLNGDIEKGQSPE